MTPTSPVEKLRAAMVPLIEQVQDLPVDYDSEKYTLVRVNHLVALRRAAEAYAGLSQSVMADGWKLVPLKATKEMCQAGYDREHDGTTPLYFKIWDAMLAAAPAPVMAVGGERRAVLEEAARLVAQKAERNEKFEGGTNSYSRSLARELREIEAAIRNLASASPSLSKERDTVTEAGKDGVE